VIRGGYGIFYNTRPRTSQVAGLYANPPATFKPQQYYGNVNSFRDASGLLGPSSVGAALPLHPAEVSTMNMSLGIQQQMGAGTVLDVAYVGTLGRHVSGFRNINQVPYGAEFERKNQSPAGGILPDNFFRPYPGYATINMQSFDLTSNYNSLQVKLTRRFSKSLGFGLAYTWSKAMDYTDAVNGGVALYQNLRVEHAEGKSHLEQYGDTQSSTTGSSPELRRMSVVTRVRSPSPPVTTRISLAVGTERASCLPAIPPSAHPIPSTNGSTRVLSLCR
jgi:hypothetical protein